MGVNVRAATAMTVAALVVITGFMGWLLYDSIARERNADGWIRHATDVRRDVGLTREDVARMEAAKRAYLLSADRSYLAERDAAAGRLRALTARLQALTSHNPEHHASAIQLAALVQERIDQAGGELLPPPLQRAALIGHGHQLSLQVYRAAEMLDQQEGVELAQRQRQQQLEFERGAGELVALIAGCLALLVPAYASAIRQQRRRERLEQEAAQMVANLPLAVWQLRTNSDGRRRFVYVAPNAAAERGLDPEALKRRYELVHESVVEDQREHFRSEVDAAERECRTFDLTYQARAQDGRVRWVHSRAALHRQDGGSILWSGFWRDVTHEKELEQALREANRELEAFSYSVSHDLRSPLAAVSAFTTALVEQEGAALTERARSYVERTQAAANQMRELIQALLMLSRLTKRTPSAEAVDLSRLAWDVAGELRAAEPGRAVQFEVQPGLVATGDPALLRQVLANLLENAWKFTRGTPQPRIEFGWSGEGGEPHFFVRDNGAGFDPANAHRLFQPFKRLHRASDFPGTGIGLATVMRIVTRHGGNVWVDARPGGGACFRFTIPATHRASEVQPS